MSRAAVVVCVTVMSVALGPAAAAQTTTGGYAYPIAWLLPLVFLVAIGLIGRALTRDLRNRRR